MLDTQLRTFVSLVDQLQEFSFALPMSYSRVEKMLQCPFAFKAIYIDKLRSSDGSLETSMGSLMHKVMENAVKFRITNKEDFAKEIRMHLGAAQYMPNEYRIAAYSEVLDPAWSILEKIFKFIVSASVTATTEKRVYLTKGSEIAPGIELPNSKSSLMGIFDLELVANNKKVSIIDYKTEYSNDLRNEIIKRQTDVYSFIEFLKMPLVEKVTNFCAYLKDGNIHLVSTYIRDNLAELAEKINDWVSQYLVGIKNMAKGEFPKKEGYQCKYCNFCR